MAITQGLREYDQNEQLWNLCERFAINIPRTGERVYYFIEGHLEKIDLTPTNLECSHDVAHFNVPSQILCRVIDIHLMVDPTTSEISFRFILLPDIGSDPTVPDPIPHEIQKHEVDSFYKILKASVTSTPGVSTRQQSPIPSSMIASQNVHLGTLATASHAVMTSTMFVVHYKQRASQFVIRLNKYLEAVNNNIHVGMRFKMRFQKEDSLNEISFIGTIVAIGNFSEQWPDSNWRSLKVHWDKPSDIQRPDKVSLWEIEPLIAAGVGHVSNPIIATKPLCFPSSKMNSNSTTSSQLKSSKASRMQVDGIRKASPLLKESSSFISEAGKEKACLNDSSSFLSESEKDKASTTALARCCNWFCCCFK